jgi:hypothetical protein
MALGDLAKRILGTAAAPSALHESSGDTDLHRSAQVSTSSNTNADHGVEHTIDDAESAPPLILGAFRSAEEHAIALLSTLRDLALEGRSLYAGDVANVHQHMCEKLDWIYRRWPAVGREFNKLDGVRKCKVWANGQRLTFYEIGPRTDDADNVIRHAAVERKRA